MAPLARIIPVFKREAAVKKTMLIALALASTLLARPAAAQLAPYNQAGITMGHWHIASKDVEANKKLFVAMGGKLYMPGGQPLIAFPGLYISLILNGETVNEVDLNDPKIKGRPKTGSIGFRSAMLAATMVVPEPSPSELDVLADRA